MSTHPTAPNRDSDRVAEIRQRLEAATGSRLAAAAIAHPNGADLRTADLAAHAPDDLAWLLSRLAVVQAERDELRAKVADGRCGGRAPSLTPAVPCVLPSGHVGWHRADSGMEWTEGPS